MIAQMDVQIILALVRVLKQVDSINLKFIDENRESSNLSSDTFKLNINTIYINQLCRGYSIIGSTMILHVVNLSSNLSISIVILTKKLDKLNLVERNTEDV